MSRLSFELVSTGLLMTGSIVTAYFTLGVIVKFGAAAILLGFPISSIGISLVISGIDNYCIGG